MSLPQFKAVMQGYEDHLFDLKCLTVYAGYWAGYYSNAKRPKPINVILQELFRSHKKVQKKSTASVRPDVDVEAFLRQEAEFNRRLQRR